MSNSKLTFYALVGLIVGLAAANVVLFIQVRGVHDETARLQRVFVAEISGFRESASMTSAAQQREVEHLTLELEAARAHTTRAAARAKADAQKHAEQLAANIEREQQNQQQQIAGELTSARAVATAANARLGEITTDVSGVKADVASTRSELDKTIAELKRTTGDLGVMSGRIATNGKELDALKRLGERDYIEFQLTKDKRPKKVGEISVLLKKVDAKRNRYTLELLADDKKIEKKDKTTNEPVQFYLANARVPYELVVNEVAKDKVTGYLSAPKVRHMAKNQ